MTVCAVVTALWQGHLLQKHNELSIYPYLQFEVNIAPHKSGKHSFSMYINNNGLGPAQIVDTQILFGEKSIRKTSEIWNELGLDDENIACGYGHIDRFYRVNDRQMVINTTSEECLLTQKQLWLLLENLNIKVIYASLYGEHFVQDWKF